MAILRRSGVTIKTTYESATAPAPDAAVLSKPATSGAPQLTTTDLSAGVAALKSVGLLLMAEDDTKTATVKRVKPDISLESAPSDLHSFKVFRLFSSSASKSAPLHRALDPVVTGPARPAFSSGPRKDRGGTGGYGYAIGVQAKQFSIPKQAGDALAEKIEEIWKEKAIKEFKSDKVGLDDYLRCIEVKFEGQSLKLRLTGWEALSHDGGWAPPKNGGSLTEGLGDWDGSMRDMKPMLLKGKRLKVLPMRVRSTAEDIKSKMMNLYNAGAIDVKFNEESLPSVLPEHIKGGQRNIKKGRWAWQARRAFLADIASQAIDKQIEALKSGRPGEFLPGSDVLTSGSGQAKKGFGRGNRSPFAGSLLDRAKVLAVSKGSADGASPRLSFLAFRTVTDGSYTSLSKKETMTERRKKARADAMRNKWLTRGRKPKFILYQVRVMAEAMIKELAAMFAKKSTRKAVTANPAG